MAQAAFKLYDASGQLILDLADHVAGDVYTFYTGKSNGSYYPPLAPLEQAVFAWRMISAAVTPGTPSPYPIITWYSDHIDWAFESSGSGANVSIEITVFKF